MYICVYVNHFPIYLKHCKSTLLQLKIIGTQCFALPPQELWFFLMTSSPLAFSFYG